MNQKGHDEAYEKLLAHKQRIGEEQFDEILGLSDHTMCKWCNMPIAWRTAQAKYIHVDENDLPIPMGRGCRSSSYDESAPYDGQIQNPKLKKHWRAEPIRRKTNAEILEAAAEKIVTEHDLERYDGESALHSLCWSLGDHIAYEKALEELVGHTIDLKE